MRLLITKYDGMGDVILFEPALRLLLDKVEGLEIAVVIREVNTALTELIELPVRWIPTKLNPYGDPKNEWNDAELKRLEESIDAFAPDRLLSGIRAFTWLDVWAADAAGADRNHGFEQEALSAEVVTYLQEKLGRTELPEWQTRRVSTEQPEYTANAEVAGAVFGFEPSEIPLPHLRLTSEARHGAEQLLNAIGLSRGEFVLYAPFGILNNPRKAWSPTKHRQLVEHIRNSHGWPVLATGASGEKSAMDDFCAGFAEPPATWLGERHELGIYAALIEASRCYIGNDTGPMHLAAALGIPVFAIFGGGHDQRFHPVGNRVAVVTRPMACFGCEWDCAWPEVECLTGLPVSAVLDFLEEWLSTGMDSRQFEWNDLAQGDQKIVGLLAKKHRAHRGEQRRWAQHRLELEGWLKDAEEDRAARLEMLKRTETELAQALTQLDEARQCNSELYHNNLRLKTSLNILQQTHQLALDLLEAVPREFSPNPQPLMPVRQSISLGANQAPLRLNFDLFYHSRTTLRLAGWVLCKTFEPIAHLRLVVKAAGVEWLTPIDLEIRTDVLENLQVAHLSLPCAFDVVIDISELPVGQHSLFLGGRTEKGKTIRHRMNRSLFVEP